MVYGERSVSGSRSILAGLTMEEIQKAIALLVEYVIGVRSQRLPSPKWKFAPRYYSIEELKVICIGDLPKHSVDLIFHIMHSIDTVLYLDTVEPQTGDMIKTEFYCTIPALYIDVVNLYAGKGVLPLKNKEGMLFEAAATSQILTALRNRHFVRKYRLFRLRSDVTGAEIDLCVENS